MGVCVEGGGGLWLGHAGAAQSPRCPRQDIAAAYGKKERGREDDREGGGKECWGGGGARTAPPDRWLSCWGKEDLNPRPATRQYSGLPLGHTACEGKGGPGV